MITDLNLKFLRKNIVDKNWLFAHPYVWDKELGRPVLTGSKWRMRGWYFCYVYTWAYWLFVVVRCLQITRSDTARITDKVFVTTMVIYCGLGLVMQLFVAASLPYLAQFGQWFFKYRSVIEDQKLIEGTPARMRFCGLVCAAYYYSVWSNVSNFTLWAVVQPSAPHLISAVSDEPGIPLRIVSVLAFFYFYAAFGSASMVCFSFAFTWFSTTITILEKIQDIDYLEQEIRNIDKLIKLYRLIQLQTKDFLACWGGSIAGAKLCLTLFTCASVYASIRLSGVAAFTLFMVGSSAAGLLFLLLSVWAGLNSKSDDFLTNLTVLTFEHPILGIRGSSYRKSVKSLRPLEIRIFFFYMIDKLNALDVINYIADNVVFLLVEY